MAVEKSDLLIFAVAMADRGLSGVVPAVDRAVGIPVAETREIVHRGIIGRKSYDKLGLGGPRWIWGMTLGSAEMIVEPWLPLL
jgi:hypothetical protein